MIKAITFDLDRVYFLKGKENFVANLGTKYGVSEDEVKRVFLKSTEMNELYKRGKWNDEQFWDFARTEWKIEATNRELIDLLIDGYETNGPVIEMIKMLKKNEYKILACSNNFPSRVEGLDKRFGFLADFDTAVFSYKVGAVKPEKEIFEKLIENSNCLPEEIVMSDDDPTKITEATNLGINTFVYENFEQFVGELKKLGVNY